LLDPNSTHGALSATKYEPFTVQKISQLRSVTLIRDPFVVEVCAPLDDGPARGAHHQRHRDHRDAQRDEERTEQHGRIGVAATGVMFGVLRALDITRSP
jgi:hypothetical protein